MSGLTGHVGERVVEESRCLEWTLTTEEARYPRRKPPDFRLACRPGRDICNVNPQNDGYTWSQFYIYISPSVRPATSPLQVSGSHAIAQQGRDESAEDKMPSTGGWSVLTGGVQEQADYLS